MLRRWAIALQPYDFTVKHVPGKLDIVPDTLSHMGREINRSPVPPEPSVQHSVQTSLIIDRVILPPLANTKCSPTT